jgi:hypothetical protein
VVFGLFFEKGILASASIDAYGFLLTVVFGLFAYLGLNFVLDTFGFGNCLHIVSPDAIYEAMLKKISTCDMF